MPHDTPTPDAVFPRRLKQARLRSGLTQEQLGIHAGIDEFSASTRVNQYEKGKHTPAIQTGQRLARALLVPTGFLRGGRPAREPAGNRGQAQQGKEKGPPRQCRKACAGIN